MQQDVVHRVLEVAGVHPQPGGGVALRVEIDHQGAVAELGQGRSQVDRGGGLADAALLIGDGEDAEAGDPRPGDGPGSTSGSAPSLTTTTGGPSSGSMTAPPSPVTTMCAPIATSSDVRTLALAVPEPASPGRAPDCHASVAGGASFRPGAQAPDRLQRLCRAAVELDAVTLAARFGRVSIPLPIEHGWRSIGSFSAASSSGAALEAVTTDRASRPSAVRRWGHHPGVGRLGWHQLCCRRLGRPAAARRVPGGGDRRVPAFPHWPS